MPVSGPQVPPGYFLVCLDEIDSTNAEALRRAAQGTKGPLWIVTQSQNKGRGRRGRTWITAPGNLFTTLLLNWHGPVHILSELSFVAAVACADMLEKQIENSGNQTDVRLKWPNDILLNGAKAGGILIETSGANAREISTAVAIGIGLNVARHPAEVLAYPTTDFTEQGLDLNNMQVFEHLANRFAHYFSLWQNGRGFALIKQRWLEFGPSLGEKLTLKTGKDVVTGGFDGLDRHGGLRLRLGDGSIQTILAGDIVAGSCNTAATEKDRL